MQNIKELRKARGLTQQALAERAHISIQLARQLDRGHRPTAVMRHAVATALDVDESELFGGSEPSC